jgi:hypothetical protein
LENYWRVVPNQLVVNPMWLNHGSVAVSEIEGVIIPDYRIYDLRLDVLPRFAHYALRSDVYRSLYGVLTRGHTTYDRRISKDDFASLPFGVPPCEYPQSVADFLDRKTAAIDALIEKKERLIALLAEKRAALIHQAVTKGLDPTVPMKPSGIPWIGDIPAHWDGRRSPRRDPLGRHRRRSRHPHEPPLRCPVPEGEATPRCGGGTERMTEFDVTPFLAQDEGQHHDRKSLWEQSANGARSPRERANFDFVGKDAFDERHAKHGAFIDRVFADKEILAYLRAKVLDQVYEEVTRDSER